MVPDKRGHFGIVCTTACARSIIAKSTFTFLFNYDVRSYVSSNFTVKKIDYRISYNILRNTFSRFQNIQFMNIPRLEN